VAPLAGNARMSDTTRFESFVREYQDMVFAVAVRLLANAAEAEDVSQTVFLKAFERFAEIGQSPSAAGWLKTVTTNACLNHLSRYRARWRFFSELPRAGDDPADAADALDAMLACAGTQPAVMPAMSAIEEASERGRLEHALAALPDHQRVPLVLFHFEDKSYQEIASLTSVSLAKVKTDIHRGRDALRKVLQPSRGPARP
jgi:RNA polymerase sigma-70 factor (ECF subfamily)